ncbi:MAG: Multidrug resistance protein MdtA precursor [Lentisphaerae bacterium ADurb.Bin242]|nr:MAG: Multidrug resistance protein MdtA precursor [Lentisphaerae bacterium ADurb.Bin242]
MNKTILPGLAALIGLLFLSGCGRKETIRELPPVPVAIGRAVIKDMPLEISTFGKVEAYSVPIKTMVTGPVGRFSIKPGDYVKNGDVLLEIDRRPFAAALQQCQATLSKDRILLEDYNRQAEMKEQLLTTRAIDFNSTRTARAQAESHRAVVAADEAAVKSALLNVEYCTIRAPIEGRVGDLLVYKGTVVKANEETVLELVQLKPIYISFAPPQTELPRIRRYFAEGRLKVSAGVPASEGAAGEGELTFIDSVVSPASGTVKMKAVFANDDLRFWPGQFVTVTLTLAVEKNCVVVPSRAVSVGQDGSYLFVVKTDSRVEYRPVREGRTLKEETVILSGLKGNERIITDGQLRLYPGAKVYESDSKNLPGSSAQNGMSSPKGKKS